MPKKSVWKKLTEIDKTRMIFLVQLIFYLLKILK